MKRFLTLCTLVIWLAAQANLMGAVFSECGAIRLGPDCCCSVPVVEPSCCAVADPSPCACHLEEADERPDTPVTPPQVERNTLSQAALPALLIPPPVFRTSERRISSVPNFGTLSARHRCARLQNWRC